VYNTSWVGHGSVSYGVMEPTLQTAALKLSIVYCQCKRYNTPGAKKARQPVSVFITSRQSKILKIIKETRGRIGTNCPTKRLRPHLSLTHRRWILSTCLGT
jgi:hypothetical protein